MANVINVSWGDNANTNETLQNNGSVIFRHKYDVSKMDGNYELDEPKTIVVNTSESHINNINIYKYYNILNIFVPENIDPTNIENESTIRDWVNNNYIGTLDVIANELYDLYWESDNKTYDFYGNSALKVNGESINVNVDHFGLTLSAKENLRIKKIAIFEGSNNLIGSITYNDNSISYTGDIDAQMKISGDVSFNINNVTNNIYIVTSIRSEHHQNTNTSNNQTEIEVNFGEQEAAGYIVRSAGDIMGGHTTGFGWYPVGTNAVLSFTPNNNEYIYEGCYVKSVDINGNASQNILHEPQENPLTLESLEDGGTYIISPLYRKVGEHTGEGGGSDADIELPS